MAAVYLALSASFQDASQLGPMRAFSLIGSADAIVQIEAADTTSRTPPGVPLVDPNSPPLVNAQGGPDVSAVPLILRGPYMRTPTFAEAGQALRYVVKAGSVTACWVDAAPMPNSGPAGTPGPNWLSNNAWALVTGTAYVAIAGELVKTDPTSGVVTVTLPTAVGIAGQRIRVQDATGHAATHTVSVATTSAQTINGGASPATITTNGGGLTLVSDGANWVSG